MEPEGLSLHSLDIDDEPSQCIERPHLIYRIREKPPWLLSILLGFQQIIPNLSSIVDIITILGPSFCLLHNDPSNAYFISAPLLVSSLATILSLYFGTRLPILVLPSMIYSMEFVSEELTCPSEAELYAMGSEQRGLLWQSKILELQGTVLCLSILKMLLGFTGIIGLIFRFSSPIIISTLVISTFRHFIFHTNGNVKEVDTLITSSVVILVVIFSQVIICNIPLPWFTLTKGWCLLRLPVFKIFSILLVVVKLSAISTFTNLPTSVSNTTLNAVPWITFNYPFQFGWPTISASAFELLMPYFFMEILTSVGEYYVCANISGELPPTQRVASQGIAMEGVATFLSGILGPGISMSSAVGSSAAISITKVASRRIVLCSAVIMLLMSFIPPLTQSILMIPSAGLLALCHVQLYVYFANGLSILRFTNLKSHRNLFIVGISLYASEFLVRDTWILPGVPYLDSFILSLIGSGITFAVVFAFLLDNILPGKRDGRTWPKRMEGKRRILKPFFRIRFSINRLPTDS